MFKNCAVATTNLLVDGIIGRVDRAKRNHRPKPTSKKKRATVVVAFRSERCSRPTASVKTRE